jgi:hypothetical protein
MNTGQGLVMSPMLLTKYLDASRQVAAQAVLLPDGLRFSSSTTRRDWTEEIVAQIRELYRQYSDSQGGDKVNLQGIVFETNQGGRLPLAKYLSALLAEGKNPQPAGLSQKYLNALRHILEAPDQSLLLAGLQERWRRGEASASAEVQAEVARWQQALWKFNTVGHIGKLNGPKAWMEPVNPLAEQQPIRLKLAPSPGAREIVLYFAAGDASDGNENDFVIWEAPRLVAPGQEDLYLRDLRQVSRDLLMRRSRVFASAENCLAAASEAGERSDLNRLAREHEVEETVLKAWFTYLGIGTTTGLTIESYFTNQLRQVSNYDFVQGWGSPETPSVVANSSDQAVRIPGNMKPHSIAFHPSPKLQAAVGWRCPANATIRIEGNVTHAHPECGNGVSWSLELRRANSRQRLASGTAQGAKNASVGPVENLALRPGDLVSLLIGPRDGNHACDLTAVDLVLIAGEGGRRWDLAADISGHILDSNPQSDRYGNTNVWHFYTEQEGSEKVPLLPAGSLLARWQLASTLAEKQKLAGALQQLLLSGPANAEEPDKQLYHQLASLRGPLMSVFRARPEPSPTPNSQGAEDASWGLDPALFDQRSTDPVAAASLAVKAPSLIEVRLPADLVAGCELVTTGRLDPRKGTEGSVQLQVLTNKPVESGWLPMAVKENQTAGPWTSNNRSISHGTPVIVTTNSAARKRFETAFDDFRRWFPAALCYEKIVPVDEVITLILFHRADEPLYRLMLDEAQQAKLDRLWDQLRFVSQDALTLVDAFDQLWQYATQDADPKVFEPLRQPILDRAAAFRRWQLETEPRHIAAVLEFAARAYRRPLTATEQEELRRFYRQERDHETTHEEAIRLTLARVLVAPSFLYRAEKPGPGAAPAPVNDWELAGRLSYFLWSSMPDDELARVVAAGRLKRELVSQTRRMLQHERVRRLATEFACQWLHVHDFEALDEKSEKHFPGFAELRGPMYEETIRFFTDLFQRNGSVLEILNADHTFLNEAMARHYGIPDVKGEQWRRVDGIQEFSRGGVLGQATVLAKQSGASRTSPILRGNWVAEVLLGDKLPKPPKDVPRLPEEEAADTLTVRQLTEKHSSDPRCYGCHQRIDAYGFVLEGFDAIGRRREQDLAGRPVATTAKAMDGTELKDIDGLRQYLLNQRRGAFARQFCRKLLGYALGRSVQLSDEPLLKELTARVEAGQGRIGDLIETIVQSRQFCDIRGSERASDD